MLEDRLTRGFVAGLIGGTAMNLLNLISVYFCRFAKCLYLDWAAAMLYGHKANSLIEAIVALIAQVVFTGFLSIIFAHLIPAITSRNFWIKGWLFGILSWFLIYAVFILFKVPEFGHRPVESVISNFFTASVYGIIQAEALLYLEKRASKN
jgi:hypothetical protein